MSDRQQLQAVITAVDKASATLRQVATNADTMGKAVAGAGQTGSKGLADLNQRMAALGAASLSAAAVLGQWNRSAQDAAAIQRGLEQAIANTGQSFALYAAAIDAAGAHAVQLGIDDEKAFQAIQALTEITGNAGTALDLLGTAEDLSAAKGIDLVSAAELIGKVHEGNVGILQRYGIVVKQGATAEEALAQIQQQTAGQAEAHATTYARLREELANVTDSIGAAVGGFAPFLQMLPGLSSGVTLVGGALGALIPEMEAATVATAALDLALGPVGLAVAGAAALVAIHELMKGNEDYAKAAKASADATKGLEDTIAGLTARGAANADTATQQFYDLHAAMVDVTNQIDVLNEKIPKILLKQGADAVKPYQAQLDLLEQALANATLAEDALNKVYQDTGTGAGLAQDAVAKLFAQFRQTGDIELLVSQLVQLGKHLGDFDVQANAIAKLTAQIAAGMADATFSMITYKKAAEETVGVEGSLADAYQKHLEATVPLIAANTENAFSLKTVFDQSLQTSASMQADADAKQAALEQTAKLTAANTENAFSLGTVFAASKETSAELAKHVEIVKAWAEAHRGAATALEGTVHGVGDVLAVMAAMRAGLAHAGTDLLRFQAGSRKASDALGAFKEVQDGLLGQEQRFSAQASEYSQQVNAMSNAHDILAQRQTDGIALTKEQTRFMDRYDEAVGRAKGGVEDATIAEGLLAEQYALNMKKGDDLNKSLDGVNSTSGKLTAAIRDLIDSLDGLNEKDAKPKVDVQGADTAKEDVQGVHAALNDIPGLTTPSIGVLGGEEAIGIIHGVSGALAALDGQTAVTSIITNNINNIINSVTNTATGPPVGRLGGVVGHRLGGQVVPVELAEAGPELLHLRGGGAALIRNRGIYGVPVGSYVDTADATAAKLSTRTTGSIVFNHYGDVNGVDGIDEMFAAMARAARTHFAGLGV